MDADSIAEFGEDLTLEDEDSEGVIKWSQVVKSWKINNFPDLDEEMLEFIQWLGMRHSESSEKIYIEKFMEIFSEDYCIDACPNEDDGAPFDPTKHEDDQDDLDKALKAQQEQASPEGPASG